MVLLFIVTGLSFLNVHSSILTKQILKWSKLPTSNEKELLSQKEKLKKEQSEFSMINEFAKYSKIQRKINKIDIELEEMKTNKNNIVVDYAIMYGFKFTLALILIFMSVYYRYTPVFKLENNIDLMPFNYFISYPNERNCVSVHFWVLCSTAVARLIKM